MPVTGWYRYHPDGSELLEIDGIPFEHVWLTARMNCGHDEILHAQYQAHDQWRRLRAHNAMLDASLGTGECTLCDPQGVTRRVAQ